MSATSAPCDSARINLRISHEAKALIERAAAIMGATVSSFMLHNAYEAARRIVADKDTLVLFQEAFEAFIAKCEKPSKPTKALRKLMALRWMSVRIERLTAVHRRASFDSGEPALNHFFQRQAGLMARRGVGKTYVALADDGLTVRRFVTISAGQVETAQLPPDLKLPRYPVPRLEQERIGFGCLQQALARLLAEAELPKEARWEPACAEIQPRCSTTWPN